jgi:hypothetical protein
MRKIKKNRERYRFNVIDKRSNAPEWAIFVKPASQA